ncbi:MAG: DNA-binding protein [Enterocloster asparagiformis]|nr:DNA-binding protein [Enterocloster asparagiformis]
MYRNFLVTMKAEGVTFSQIGSLLGCRYQTVSDTVNGETKKGFYYEDAVTIRDVLFPKYDLEYLFKKEKNG